MGEKDETKIEGEKKNNEEDKKIEGEKKAAEDGGKKDDDDGLIAIVLKLDLHCDGCAKKVKRAIRRYQGVEDVKADSSSGKVTVKGSVDPIWLRDKIADKTKKKVELLSPPPKKDGGGGGDGGGDKKHEEKPEKKQEEKKTDDNKLKESTVVFKIKLHCDGCAHKIKRIISKFDGVKLVSLDSKKDLITVNGTMDVNELIPYLKGKLNRSVDIIPPKKEDGGGNKGGKEGSEDKKEKESGGGSGGDKKEKEGGDSGGGGGEKKDHEAKGASGDNEKKDSEAKATGGGDGSKNEEPKMEMNKMEYYGYNPYTYYSAPMSYNQNYMNQDYGATIMYNQGHANTGSVVGYSHMPNTGYIMGPSHVPGTSYIMGYSHVPLPPPPTYLHQPPPQMFSDENPNACSVM